MNRAAAAEALHYVMTHQPSKAILWAQDQRRAVMLRDYVWVLYEQQEPILNKATNEECITRVAEWVRLTARFVLKQTSSIRSIQRSMISSRYPGILS